MTELHACFAIGALAVVGLVLVITALFGWAFIALVESKPSGDGRTDQ